MNRNVTAAMIGCVSLLGGAFVTAQQDPRTALTALLQPPQWESCDEMHDMYTRRFANARGFGLARMPQPGMTDRSGVLDTGRIRYALDSIELVGLLKPGTPIAYVPDLHTERPSAADFKSRPLTEAEDAAIAAFRQGRDIVSTRDASGALLCVGALRAKESCVGCHQDKKAGDLLGAFSYRMRENR
jgi:hypothetical protein